MARQDRDTIPCPQPTIECECGGIGCSQCRGTGTRLCDVYPCTRQASHVNGDDVATCPDCDAEPADCLRRGFDKIEEVLVERERTHEVLDAAPRISVRDSRTMAEWARRRPAVTR